MLCLYINKLHPIFIVFHSFTLLFVSCSLIICDEFRFSFSQAHYYYLYTNKLTYLQLLVVFGFSAVSLTTSSSHCIS